MTLPFLAAADVAERLSPTAAIDALEAALRSGLDPEADPPRGALAVGAGELLVMPSATAAHAVVKLVTVGGEPRIQGVCVVFDAATLAPVALVDGIALTNVRTPAVSALAVRALAAPDARRLLVFGRGPQAHGHVEAIRAVRPIEHVDMVGRDADGVDELVAAADVVCCATTARAPLFDGSLVADHATVVAIGSHEPEARETDDTLARRATVVVESRTSALREAGDVIGAIAAGALREDELVTLADLVCGRRLGSRRPAALQEHRYGVGGRGGGVGARPLTLWALRRAYCITEGKARDTRDAGGRPPRTPSHPALWSCCDPRAGQLANRFGSSSESDAKPKQFARGDRVRPRTTTGAATAAASVSLGDAVRALRCDRLRLRRSHRVPDPHDVAGRQLQRHRVVARELHRERGAVGELELGADLEAQVDDAVDHRLERAVARLGGHAQVVRAHERLAEARDGARGRT